MSSLGTQARIHDMLSAIKDIDDMHLEAIDQGRTLRASKVALVAMSERLAHS